MTRGGHRCGAGRPAKRPRVEACAALDVRHLHATGALRHADHGAIDTGAGGRVWYRTRSARISLHHEFGSPAFQVVAFDSTPTNLGRGVRWWLRCPACNRRCMRLFWPPAAQEGFACRRCARVTYPSQRLGAFDRADLRMRQLKAVLGPDGAKPAGMILRTYMRLRAALANAEVERDATFIAMAVRLGEP